MSFLANSAKEKSESVEFFSNVLCENKTQESFDAIRAIEEGDSEFSLLLNAYCKCLLTLGLNANASTDSLLNAICLQTLQNISKQKKQFTVEEIEKKCKLLESKLASLKDEWSTAATLMKQSKECRKRIAEKSDSYTRKFHEYYNETKLLESHLSSSGFSAALKDEALTAVARENEQLKKELDMCTKKLEDYREFKPNNASLSKRIAELNKEIMECDKYFNRESL